MKNVFGETGAMAVYHHLEEGFLLKLGGILEEPLVFTQGLIEMYGETAAEFIESLLVKDLSTELGMSSEPDELKGLANLLCKYKTAIIEER